MIQSMPDPKGTAADASARSPKQSVNLWRKVLKKLFADRLFEELTPDQNIAVLEALEIGVMADGEVTEEELRLLRSDVWKLPWAWNQDDSEVEELLAAAVRRLDVIRSNEDALLEYTERLVDRIPKGAVREAVYEMMVELAHADGAGDWELDILEVFRRAAGISTDRARQIADRIRGPLRFG